MKGKNNEAKPKYEKPNWYRRTERLLKWYKYLPAEIENLKLELEYQQLAGPPVTAQLRQDASFTNSVSSPLAAVVAVEETLQNKIRVKEIAYTKLENTINSLNPEEYQVYRYRYELECRDKEVYNGLDMSRSAYFELQKKVILKSARLLNIPVPKEDQPEEWTGELFEKSLD